MQGAVGVKQGSLRKVGVVEVWGRGYIVGLYRTDVIGVL